MLKKIANNLVPITVLIILFLSIFGLVSVSSLPERGCLEIDDTGTIDIDFDSGEGTIFVNIYNRADEPVEGLLKLSVNGELVEETHVVVDGNKIIYLDFTFNSNKDKISLQLEQEGETVREIGFRVDRYPYQYSFN
ncbi:hypothetical protein AMET1_1418 [Methanonatronarchaeum thermophilum]|uniref:Uncharacterized protein n=1 Tax=Methanonatronarchaeum thermophilum TaxID=1927129 RepID=A0A1Y3GAR0_9EURY|nr:hypothetical protein [Methanonatronarchaeum thermophilum]OUJ18499.1 hypothetical protein AMET1_1418 [Methanonatronarchaeum thermophilum]